LKKGVCEVAYAKKRKFLLAAVAAAVMLLVAGVAYANGSSEQATGASIEKAKSVALDHVNGRVTGTEVGDEEGYYEIEVTREDGSQVDVHLDRDFNVLNSPADNEGHDDKDGPEDGGG
jgi:uncharacterized membrane protein YkoI